MIKFDTVEEFFDFIPGNERAIAEALREIIFECIPGVKEKLSYNVPYYYGKRRICFIWPSSIPWGNVKKDGVLLGFCYGNLLTDDLNILEKGQRKQVFAKTFLDVSDINQDLIRKYLFQAVEIDEVS